MPLTCHNCGRNVPANYRVDLLCENCFALAMSYAERFRPQRVKTEGTCREYTDNAASVAASARRV